MLLAIRDKAHGWVAWVIFSFIAITFAMWGTHNYFQDSEETSVAATVNGKKIRAAEVKRVAQNIRQQQAARLGPQAMANPLVEQLIKQEALQSLVKSAVLTSQAEKLGFTIDQEQILIALKKIPAFQIDGEFSPSRFNSLLQQSGLNDQQFYSRIYQDMLTSQLQEQYANSHFVLPSDITLVTQLLNQVRTVDYLQLTAKDFTKTAKVDDAAVQQYYDTHEHLFQIPEQIRVEYVTLSMQDLAAKAAVNDDEIQQYYKQNIAGFTEKAQWKVSYILKQLDDDMSEQDINARKDELSQVKQQALNGKSFAALAKTHSDDALTKKDGGSMGWLHEGDVDSSFESIVTSMSTIGDISKPIRTSYGLVIIRLDDIKPAKVKPLADVKDDVTKALREHKSARVFAEASETFANLSFEQPDSLSPVADELRLTIKESDYFNRQGGETAFTKHAQVLRAAFSDDVLLTGNNSEVLQLDPETLAVLRLKDRKPASTKSLADVKAQIEGQMKSKAALKQAQDTGFAIITALQAGEQATADKLIAALPKTIVWKSSELKRLEMDAEANETDAFLQQVFAMPRNKADKPDLAGFKLDEGYVVVKLKSVKQSTLDEAKTKQQEEWIKGLLSQRYSYLVRELYMQALLQQADVDLQQ